MDIRDMREKRAKLAADMRAILDGAQNEKRSINADEEARFSALENDLNTLDKDIAREERMANVEAELRKSANGEKKPEARAEGKKDAEYRRAFGEYLRSGNTAELRATGAELGGNVHAGYLAPVALEKALISEITAQNIMRQIADVRTSETDVDIPVVSTHPTAYLITEGSSITASTPAFNHVQMKAYKMAARTYVTWEALEDVFMDYDKFIADEFAAAFAACEEGYFVTGTGSSQPSGVVTGASAGLTAAGTTAITADEIIGLVYSVAEKYRRNGSFLMNDATIGAIRKLKDSTNNYLWQPSLTAGQPDMLLGKPVHTSSSMATIAASAVPVLFGDFKKYRIQDRAGIRIQRLNELAAATGEVGFVAHHRTDGHLLVADAIKKITMHA